MKDAIIYFKNKEVVRVNNVKKCEQFNNILTIERSDGSYNWFNWSEVLYLAVSKEK